MSLLTKEYFKIDNFINKCNYDQTKEKFIDAEETSTSGNTYTTNVDLNVTSPLKRRRRRKNRYWYNNNRHLFNDPSIVVVSDNDSDSDKSGFNNENIKMFFGAISLVILIMFLFLRNK